MTGARKIEFAAGAIQDAKQDRDKLVGLPQLDQMGIYPPHDFPRRTAMQGLCHDQCMRAGHEDGGRDAFI